MGPVLQMGAHRLHIDYLPDSKDDVEAMTIVQVRETVLLLTDPDLQIGGAAAMSVNAFMAWAAVRLAGEHKVLNNRLEEIRRILPPAIR